MRLMFLVAAWLYYYTFPMLLLAQDASNRDILLLLQEGVARLNQKDYPAALNFF